MKNKKIMQQIREAQKLCEQNPEFLRMIKDAIKPKSKSICELLKERIKGLNLVTTPPKKTIQKLFN